MKKKFVFIGDTNSINLEIICKSHKFLKNKVYYILLGHAKELFKLNEKINCNLGINLIYDPINPKNYNKDFLNVFDIDNISKHKYKNLLHQIDISNHIASKTKIDLVTMPVNKSIFKKEINFIGMTEHLGKINNVKTTMIMVGDKFSIIPLTTHINLSRINSFINKKVLVKTLKEILLQIKKDIYRLEINNIKFLCYNPHCGENSTLGVEDNIISNSLSKFKKITGPYPADSAFNKISPKTLYLSMYHDQALIPFKILNKKALNLTLGLNYRRISPAHGTAADIKFKGTANNSSYIECMQC